MKFVKLVGKFEKLLDNQARGKRIRPDKLEKLQQLLADKKSRYESKLASTQNPDKRKKLETRLKVVAAQLDKSKQLSSDE